MFGCVFLSFVTDMSLRCWWFAMLKVSELNWFQMDEWFPVRLLLRLMLFFVAQIIYFYSIFLFQLRYDYDTVFFYLGMRPNDASTLNPIIYIFFCSSAGKKFKLKGKKSTTINKWWKKCVWFLFNKRKYKQKTTIFNR